MCEGEGPWGGEALHLLLSSSLLFSSLVLLAAMELGAWSGRIELA